MAHMFPHVYTGTHTQHPYTPHLGQGLAPGPATLTLFGHAHFEAFLQPAVLAAVPGHLVDDTVLVPVTRIHHVLLDTASEEALGTGEGVRLSTPTAGAA